MDDARFRELMNQLATAWTTQNTQQALACFTPDAVYMQPPDQQFYRGHTQLKPYFGALKKGTTMTFHNLWFDEQKQTGTGEFTFGNTLTKSAVTGVAVVQLQNGKISFWREYFVKGPLDFREFISTENKAWKWHIGNYP
ncbi:hypothetical protein AWR27_06390 [Spirosoma montaniterrae]|uniref:SnoaL-like domain-containing protein n=2 Tax=Spirosoma montaniterrae TaxID=1178516 RepID=A0A1P9WUG4_9BACT|nr:hypothetical protein AWR27_06390 [Spirosoma montaniterrae]